MENPMKIWPSRPASVGHSVTGTDVDRSASYDFLLVIPSNHGPISWRLEDGDLGRKSQIFPTHRVFNAPAEGVPLWSFVPISGGQTGDMCSARIACWSAIKNKKTLESKHTSCARYDTICPALLLPSVGSPAHRPPPSRRNVAVLSQAEYVHTRWPLQPPYALRPRWVKWPGDLDLWPFDPESGVWRGLPLCQFWSS